MGRHFRGVGLVSPARQIVLTVKPILANKNDETMKVIKCLSLLRPVSYAALCKRSSMSTPLPGGCSMMIDRVVHAEIVIGDYQNGT